MERSEEFPASMEHLPGMLIFTLQNAQQQGFDKEKLGQIELAVEEILVNIIQHGYSPAEPGKISITCMNLPSKGIKIVIKDQAPPFDPIAKVKGFDPEVLIQEGTEGGFGIFLATKMVDEFSYHRADGSNEITLIKNS